MAEAPGDVVEVVRAAVARVPSPRLHTLALSPDGAEVDFARGLLARAVVEALRQAGHLPLPGPAELEAPPPSPPGRDRGRGKGRTVRDDLRAAVAFALRRTPRDWLRRLWAERNADDVAALVAARVVAQIELANFRYHLGPPSGMSALADALPAPPVDGRRAPR